MTERSENYEVKGSEAGPDPFLPGPGAMLVLGELELSGKQNETMLVTARVVELTVESKFQAGEYQNVRAYQRFEPERFYVHVPVVNPAQYVGENGDADLLGYVHRQLARALDLALFQVASQRMDMQAKAADQEAAEKGGVKIGQVAQVQQQSNVL